MEGIGCGFAAVAPNVFGVVIAPSGVTSAASNIIIESYAMAVAIVAAFAFVKAALWS